MEDEPGCPQGVSGRHVVPGRQSSPVPAPNSCSFYSGRGECARVTGKAGENGQHSAAGLRAHPGRDRQLSDVVTHPRLQRVNLAPLGLRWGPGQPGSGVAVDWVTGRSCFSANPKRRDGSTYSQAFVRAAPCCGSGVATRDRE